MFPVCRQYAGCKCLLLVGCVIGDSPLTEPRELLVARAAVGTARANLCQAFVPIHCDWRGASLAACLVPLRSPKKTVIKRGRESSSDTVRVCVEPHPFSMFLKILLNEDNPNNVSTSNTMRFNCQSLDVFIYCQIPGLFWAPLGLKPVQNKAVACFHTFFSLKLLLPGPRPASSCWTL